MSTLVLIPNGCQLQVELYKCSHLSIYQRINETRRALHGSK